MEINKERLIYTAGTFEIEDDMAACRRVIIRSSILRLPDTTNYVNERSNPRKYFLGYVSVFIGDYVYKVFPLEYEQQIVLFWDNLESQINARMLCEFANVNTNLVALRTSIPLAGSLIPIPQPAGTFPACPFTILKFKLVFGTRIQVTGIGEELETCEEAEPEPTRPDPAPPPPPYPPEQPRDEDPPRSDPEPGEDPGDTAPVTPEDPESDGAPPPYGEECEVYAVEVSWTNSSGTTSAERRSCYGEIGSVRQVFGMYGDAQSIEIQCRGLVGAGACGAFDYYRFTGGASGNVYDSPFISDPE